jgi:hypothetical protein
MRFARDASMKRAALRSALPLLAVALVGCGFADHAPGANRASDTSATSHVAGSTTAYRSTSPARRVPHHKPSTRSSTPRQPAGPSTAGLQRSAASFVRHFYTQVAARDFASAWTRLPSAVRASSGSLDAWRAGYATTISSDPSDVSVDTSSAGTATVSLTLRATDLDACADKVRQRFAVRWTLRRGGDHWVADAVAAQKVSGRTPRQDPAECQAPADDAAPTTVDDGTTAAGGEDSSFCPTHVCIPNYDNGRGATVMCSDGQYSQSGGIQGACSHHGGVAGRSSAPSVGSTPSYTPSTSSGGTVHVDGYTRRDGTYVAPYTRRAPCSYC